MIVRSLLVASWLLGLFLAGPASAETGIASVYGANGGRTANGERVQPAELTAAHRTLPFNTYVTVVNHKNGKMVMVRINDRGPFINGRVIDLTPAAADALGFNGLVPVTIVRD